MFAVRNNNRTPKGKSHCVQLLLGRCAMGSIRPPIVAHRTAQKPLCNAQHRTPTHTNGEQEEFDGNRRLLWHKPRRNREAKPDQIRAAIELGRRVGEDTRGGGLTPWEALYQNRGAPLIFNKSRNSK
jgi:hypothetical protein